MNILPEPPKPKYTPEEIIKAMMPQFPQLKMEEIFSPPKTVNDLMERTDQLFFGSTGKTLFDAVNADMVDNIVGLVPFLGDLFELPRVSDALKKSEDQYRGPKTLLFGLDTVIGIVPFIGDAADILLPANTISFLGDRVIKNTVDNFGNMEVLPTPSNPTGFMGLPTPRGLFEFVGSSIPKAPKSG